jgi:hypothetical protein
VIGEGERFEMKKENGIPLDFHSIFDVIDYIEQNPKKTKIILDLTFPRIFTPEGYSLCQFIAKAANLNPRITEGYIKRYYSEFSHLWPTYDSPLLCECFISNNLDAALKTLETIPAKSRDDILFKVQFYRCILQKCETDIQSVQPLIQKIANHIKDAAQSIPYVSNLNYTKKECITSILEKSLQLIDEIEDRIHIKEFDYAQLNQTLDNYPQLKKYAGQIISDCQQKKKFSSLLWLLDLGDAEKNIYDRGIPQKPGDILYKQCVLEILNRGIQLYTSLPNQKSTTLIRKENDLKSKLKNENEFWDLISELIILLRISDSPMGSQILIKDRQIGQKKNESTFIDIEIELPQRKVLLEITSPRMQKNVLFQKAGFLTNHYASVIGGKREQLNKGLKKENTAIDNFSEPYYIIIDTTKTPFGYTCQDIFEYTSTGIDLVGGIILINWMPVIKNNHPHIEISATIRHNPNGKNLLSNDETTELKRILSGVA